MADKNGDKPLTKKQILDSDKPKMLDSDKSKKQTSTADQLEDVEVAHIDETIVSKVGDKKSNIKLNKFDVFFIRIWSFICAAILKFSYLIVKGIKFVIKKEIPVRYVVATVSTLLVVALIALCAAPFTRTVSVEDIEIYHNNLIAVQKEVGKDDVTMAPIYKWGYVNKKGATKIDFIYEDAMDFKYKVAFVLVSEKTGSSTYSYWKLINTKGKDVGSYQFSQTIGAERVVSEFSDTDKLAKVCLAGNYGFINTSGKMQINAEYDDAGSFVDGKARVGRGSTYYFINKKGKQVSSEFSYARDYVEGYAAVKTLSGMWQFINNKCESITEAKFDAVSDFHCGYAAVKLGSSYAIINTSGEYVVKSNLFSDIKILGEFELVS